MAALLEREMHFAADGFSFFFVLPLRPDIFWQDRREQKSKPTAREWSFLAIANVPVGENKMVERIDSSQILTHLSNLFSLARRRRGRWRRRRS
jgi:hypothetical protein